jgi:hypothetical protein
MAVIHVKYITVAGKGDRKLLESYLYSHTNIIEFTPVKRKGQPVFLATLRTEADSDHAASFYANVLSARLSSGLIQSKVGDAPMGILEAVDTFAVLWP